MCDCYEHKCECCDELIPVHIGGFKFPRTDFQVWCKDHTDKAPKGAVVFEVTAKDDDWGIEPVGWKCAILGPGVGRGVDGNNHPNLAGILKCERIK